MIPGFGKDKVFIGSAPDCDIVLPGPGVAPRHAVLTKQGPQLHFTDLGAGQSFANGAPLPPNQPTPYDFRVQFAVGGVPVPLSHPVILAMLLARGHVATPRGHVVIGREPSKASLAIVHPSVSGHHATVMLDRMMVIDHGSTSGTWVAGRQCAPNQPTPLDPNGLVAFGPVPIPVPLLVQIEQAMAALGPRVPSGPQGQVSGPVMQAPTAAMPGAAGQSGTAMAPAMQIPPGAAAAPGPGPAAPRAKHRTVIGELNMSQLSATNVITIGRTPENKIVVPHPQVSSRHAQIHKVGAQLFLEDLRSANGTYVQGRRIPPGQRVPVQDGEKVYIGPMPLLIHIADQQVNVIVEDSANWAGKPLYEIEAWDLSLEVPDRDNPGAKKILLDRVSFKALPGDMIALMGPSGAGKTTLLTALNGYLPPTSGVVRVNGEDLYSIYDALRGVIGYVPQDDIVHPELTVFEAVKYSARFRLPPDYSDAEIDRRVEETLKDLGLEGVKNLQIGKPEKKVLSGGQRKRVNIALELVTDPVILFLDEPTSGLAADDTTTLITLLSELTKRTGKTIIMTIHQPARDEYEKFNLAFIMGFGGIPVYYGPTGEASYAFFSTVQSKIPGHAARTIDNPRDMFDMLNVRERYVLDQMKQGNPNVPRAVARLAAAREWRQEFYAPQNPLYAQMYGGRRTIGQQGISRGVPGRADVALVRQLFLLLSRYLIIKVRDRVGSAIMFLQAPIIGLLLWAVFGPQTHAKPFWCIGALNEIADREKFAAGGVDILKHMKATPDYTSAMFLVVLSCVWFGTSNAAREIVTEQAIYKRERMVNLSLFNYVFSKFILLSIMVTIQCTMLLGIVFVTLGFSGGISAFLWELISLVALGINATALGLLISTMVTSAEAAMALTPIALIPQIVLGGMMVPMTSNTSLKYAMLFVPARWGFQGAIAQERDAISGLQAWNIPLPPMQDMPSNFIKQSKFQCAIAQIQSEKLQGAWGFVDWREAWLAPSVLLGMTLVMVVLLLIMLKRRDPV